MSRKTTFEWIRAGILMLAFSAMLIFAGCQKKTSNGDLQWSVSNDGLTVYGTLVDCGCSGAEIEMLVTDENTGRDYYTNFTIEADVRFERPVGVLSNVLSINLEVVSVK